MAYPVMDAPGALPETIAVNLRLVGSMSYSVKQTIDISLNVVRRFLLQTPASINLGNRQIMFAARALNFIFCFTAIPVANS
ncbi:MAG: hypothetical protein SCH71_10490 [Desulfobulbaceae bacterium]|nr:hypothetical protein [Desulfobulbaceae bacterium]